MAWVICGDTPAPAEGAGLGSEGAAIALPVLEADSLRLLEGTSSREGLRLDASVIGSGSRFGRLQ